MAARGVVNVRLSVEGIASVDRIAAVRFDGNRSLALREVLKLGLVAAVNAGWEGDPVRSAPALASEPVSQVRAVIAQGTVSRAEAIAAKRARQGMT